MAKFNDDVRSTAKLFEAAEKGNILLLKKLIKEDRNINQQNNAGKTALMLAAENGHVNCVNCLLNIPEVDPNVQDKHGMTTLSLAAINGHDQCIQSLIGKVNLNMYNVEGRTAFMSAAMNGHLKCIELLGKYNYAQESIDQDCIRTEAVTSMEGHVKEHGSCMSLVHCSSRIIFDDCDNEGNTAFMLAASNGNKDCLIFLMDRAQVDFNRANSKRKTALMLASTNNHSSCVDWLSKIPNIGINMQDVNGRTALMLAAKFGNNSCVSKLLNVRGIKINLYDSKLKNCLMLSAKYGNLECLKLISGSEVADFRIKDENGRTALMLAAINGHIDCVKYLVKICPRRECIINLKEVTGNTALTLAIQNKNPEIERIVEFLISLEGIDLDLQNKHGYTALMLGTYFGKTNYVEALIKTNRVDVKKKNKDGRTALMLAIMSANFECFKSLCNVQGQDLNVQDNDGCTALILAADIEDRLDYVKYLTQRVSKNTVDIQDRGGNTAIAIAAEKGYANYLETLLDVENINVNGQNLKGHTALMLCAMNDHVECMKLLLNSSDLNVNQEDDKGNTALAIAAKKGYANCIQTLLDVENIDVNGQNLKGQTALMLCAMNDYVECVKLLLSSSDLNVNQKDVKGNTAIMLASKNGHSECVKLLLGNKGLNFQTCNKSGHNFLMLACLKGHCEVLKCFIDIRSKGQTSLNTWNSEQSQYGVTAAPIFISNYQGICFQYYSDIKWNRPYINRSTQETKTLLNIKLGTVPCHFTCVSCFLLGRVDGSVTDICNYSNSPIIDTQLCTFDHEGNTDLMLAARKGFVECLEYLLQIHRVRFHTLVLLFNNELSENGTISLILYRKLCCLIRDHDQTQYFLTMIYRGDSLGQCVDFLLSAYLCQLNESKNSAISLAVFEEHTDCLGLLLEHVSDCHKLNQYMKDVFLYAAKNLEKLNFIPIFLKAGIFDWSWYPDFPHEKQRFVARELVINGYSPRVFDWKGRLSSPLHHAIMIKDIGLFKYLVTNLYMTSSDLIFLQQCQYPKEISNQPWRLEALSIIAINSFLKNKIREKDISSISKYHNLKGHLETRLSFMKPIRWLCVKQWRLELPLLFPINGRDVNLSEKDFLPGKCCNGACIIIPRNKSQRSSSDS